jgi:hypothetical protein
MTKRSPRTSATRSRGTAGFETNGVGVHETDVAGRVVDLEPRLLQPIPDALLVVHLLYDSPGREEHPGKVYFRCRAPETVVGELLRVPHEPGGLGERPGRDAAVVGAGPAELVALDQDDLGPQLPGPQGRGYPRRPSSYYH